MPHKETPIMGNTENETPRQGTKPGETNNETGKPNQKPGPNPGQGGQRQE